MSGAYWTCTLRDSGCVSWREELKGRIRLVVPDDYAAKYLAPVLKRFAPQHRSVEIELDCEKSTSLIHRVECGELDLALVSQYPPDMALYYLMNL